MPRTMKSSTTKVVIVKINGKKNQVTVDTAIHDDIFVEAATRVVEKQRGNASYFTKTKLIGLCYLKDDHKNPERHQHVNLYYVLMNAGFYDLAELVRDKTKEAHKVDLQTQPMRCNAGKPPIV